MNTALAAKRAPFHLSLAVNSLKDSENFFKTWMGATVTHRDPSGYVNLDFFGTQITLQCRSRILGSAETHDDLHFGVNLGLKDFTELVSNITQFASHLVVAGPSVVDRGTPLERHKIYLRCPTGYLVEIKGFQKADPLPT